jgi:hypothetical protein
MGLYLTNRFICAARNVSLMVDFFRTSYEKSRSLVSYSSMSYLVSQTVVFTVSCGFSTLFINLKPLRRFAFRTFAFLSPYRHLKATIRYPDVLHPSKDQPFRTFHVFFIPFFLCLILYLFILYYSALTSAKFGSKDKYTSHHLQ